MEGAHPVQELQAVWVIVAAPWEWHDLSLVNYSKSEKAYDPLPWETEEIYKNISIGPRVRLQQNL